MVPATDAGGSANFNAGPLMAFSSGNLCYQIEHHLFPPDLPSNRLAEIAARCGPSATSTDCPTTRARWHSSTFPPCGPSTGWRCRIARPPRYRSGTFRPPRLRHGRLRLSLLPAEVC